MEELGDQLIMLGPYNESTVKMEVELMEPENELIKGAMEGMRKKGIKVRIIAEICFVVKWGLRLQLRLDQCVCQCTRIGRSARSSHSCSRSRRLVSDTAFLENFPAPVILPSCGVFYRPTKMPNILRPK